MYVFSTHDKNRYFKIAMLVGVFMSLGLISADAVSKHKHIRDTQIIREIYVIKTANTAYGATTALNPSTVVTTRQSCDVQGNVGASSSNIIIKNISPASKNYQLDSNYRKQRNFLVKTAD